MACVDVRANTMDKLQEFKREVGVELFEVLKKNGTIFGDDFIMLSSTLHEAAAPSALSENSSSSSGLNSGRGGDFVADFVAKSAAAAN